MSQFFPPPGNKCNEFGGGLGSVADPPVNLLQFFPPPGNKCNEFGGGGYGSRSAVSKAALISARASGRVQRSATVMAIARAPSSTARSPSSPRA